MKNSADSIRPLPLNKIRIDGGTQPRSELSQSVVDEYAEAIQAGAGFPPAIVFYDGKDYWLADGFHRLAGHRKAGQTEMPCEVRTGTRRDAVLYAVGANATHGLPRTNADKRRAVLILLNDPEWAKWSNNEIAKRCGVSHTFVNQLRSLETVSSDDHRSLSSDDSETRTYTTKHGTTATMDTGAIGRRSEPKPDAKPVPAPAVDKPDPEEDEDPDEGEEESDEALPPVPPGDIRDEAIADPERRATHLLKVIRGSIIAFRDQKVLRDVMKADPAIRTRTLKAMQSVAQDFADLVAELESKDEAREDKDRRNRRQAG